MSDSLIVEVRNQIAIVTINRPKVRNAFDPALVEELTRAFRGIDSDDSVRALVIASTGTVFCSGADLNGMRESAGHSAEQHLSEARALAEMLKTLDRMKKPTVARVQGPAYGGGAGLVAACDIAVGAHEAEFCLSEVKLGLAAAVIAPYVVRAMGERMARRYFLSGESIDAGEAYRLRLLSDVAPKEELDGTVNGILGHLVMGGRETQASIKDMLPKLATRPLDDALVEDSAQWIARSRASAEGKEGVAAFLEKRKPAWVTQFEAVRVKPPRKKK